MKDELTKNFKGADKEDISIFDMVTPHWEDIYEEIGNVLKNNSEYLEAYEEFGKELKLIDDNKKRIRISDYASAMEARSQEEGYSKGFADAVKLMAACFSKK